MTDDTAKDMDHSSKLIMQLLAAKDKVKGDIARLAKDVDPLKTQAISVVRAVDQRKAQYDSALERRNAKLNSVFADRDARIAKAPTGSYHYSITPTKDEVASRFKPT